MLGIDWIGLSYELVNWEEIYTIASQINEIASLSTKNLNKLYNALDIAELNKGILGDFYGIDEEEAAIWIDSVDIEGAYDLAYSELTINENGLYSLDMDLVLPFVFAEYDNAGLDYQEAGITEDTITDVVKKVFDYMLYSDITFYEGEDPFAYIYDADIYGIMFDVV